jgi:hypothetical protein
MAALQIGDYVKRVLLHGERWVIRGSRLLPACRTATRQSGSPPGTGRCAPLFLAGRERTTPSGTGSVFVSA